MFWSLWIDFRGVHLRDLPSKTWSLASNSMWKQFHFHNYYKLRNTYKSAKTLPKFDDASVFTVRSLIERLLVAFGGAPNFDVADSLDGAYLGPFIDTILNSKCEIKFSTQWFHSSYWQKLVSTFMKKTQIFEFSLNIFTEFSEFSDTKYYISKRLFEPATRHSKT